ncbi:esterase/lipase family protein [Rhodopirellula sp. MGV]|uniref:esterase/lipase family protein n=1 Tax=Rhodopirellula sp. MGV TaxID=2023130 RepID=UPI00117BC1BE|nr:lipase [Rhodopirellula sp. MGV]
MQRSLLLCFALIVSLQCHRHQVHSDEHNLSEHQEHQSMTDRTNFNLPIKTAGGTQLWTDHQWRNGYRIQQNALTGHWRLLDSQNVRRAWGSRMQCQAALEGLCPKAETSASTHYVILLHGLMRTSGSMKSLEPVLAEAGLPDCIRFSYASTRFSIGKHSAALREVLEDLPNDATFSFVGHSMGNIVVRHLISDLQLEGDPHHILDRCQTMVMLGPPNQGAAIARRLGKLKLFEWVTGQGGIELGPEWEDLQAKLATPPFPFHIIAGDINPPIANPLVDGESDYVVSVDEAKLDGSASFQTVPVLHSFLMSTPDVMHKTAELLKPAS